MAALIIAAGILLCLALCKVSGDCSRQEEKEERERRKDG